MKIFLCIVSLLIGSVSNAQTWSNLTIDETKPGLEINPLKGFADLYGPENSFPRSINGKIFPLNDVMTGFDTYDWTVINAFIAQNKIDGNFSYLQVNIDPGFGGSYMPDFLAQVDCANDDSAGGPLDGSYCAYNYTSGLPDLVPDWNDEDIVSAMERFTAAFGVEFNDQPEVFMVHLGLYGIFGEWQIGSAIDEVPDFEMTPDNKSRVATAFRDAFPNTQLMARYPEHMPDPEIYGYSDGLFFTQSISDNTFFNNGFFNNTIAAYNANNNWRLRVIGGEIDPCAQTSIWLSSPNNPFATCENGDTVAVQDAEESLRATHTSFLFTHHIFQTVEGPAEGSDEWNNALNANKLMGYTFHVDEYRLTALNREPAIEVNIKNIGIAPMYANWDVEFAALNSDGQFLPLGTKKWNLNLIQPEVQKNYRSFVSDVSLLDGTYTIIMRVANPLEAFSSAAQPVRFANATQDDDLDGWLTLGDAVISAGPLGVIPRQVSEVVLSETTASLIVDGDLQLVATLDPVDATDQTLTWVSDHPGTAAVSESGFVTTGPAYGIAKVYAYSNDVGATTETPVAVVEITVAPNRVVIPAVIEAEDFIRMSGIVSGFGKIAFIDSTDWIEYGVIVNPSANFFLDIYAGCPEEDGMPPTPCLGEITIKDDSGSVLDVVGLVTTDGFDDFQPSTSSSILLPEGAYNIELEASVGGFDLDKIEFREDPGVDSDTDGVPDAVDNCIDVPNADQRDTNGDGYGNVCDADFDNNGVVNFVDISSWVPLFNTACGDIDQDLNGDGICNFGDYSLIVPSFLQPPGPSGIAP